MGYGGKQTTTQVLDHSPAFRGLTQHPSTNPREEKDNSLLLRDERKAASGVCPTSEAPPLTLCEEPGSARARLDLRVRKKAAVFAVWSGAGLR